MRLAQELAQISRAQEAARKIHAEHPPIPTEYLPPEAIKAFIKHGPPARNVRRNAGPKPKLCPVCGLPETREKPFEVAHKIPHTAGVRAGFTPEYLGRRENLIWAHRGKCNDMVEIPPEFWITEAKREAALATVRVITSENKTDGGNNIETPAETVVASGKLHASKGQYNSAIVDFDEAIRLDPQHAVAFSDRGAAYDAKKDYDRAIADYSEAIRLVPHEAHAFFNRGDAYENKGDYDRAIADYGQTIRTRSERRGSFL